MYHQLHRPSLLQDTHVLLTIYSVYIKTNLFGMADIAVHHWDLIGIIWIKAIYTGVKGTAGTIIRKHQSIHPRTLAFFFFGLSWWVTCSSRPPFFAEWWVFGKGGWGSSFTDVWWARWVKLLSIKMIEFWMTVVISKRLFTRVMLIHGVMRSRIQILVCFWIVYWWHEWRRWGECRKYVWRWRSRRRLLFELWDGWTEFRIFHLNTHISQSIF